jgi:predicted small secreted protein
VPLLSRSFSRKTGEIAMIRKVMTVALIAGSMSIAACNTVRGAASDVNSAANAVDNKI